MGDAGRSGEDRTFWVNFAGEGGARLQEKVIEKLNEIFGDYSERKAQRGSKKGVACLGDDSSPFAMGSSLSELASNDHFGNFNTDMVVISAFESELSLEVMDHPVLDLIYYTLTEILPSALVLYILRKLPPKRVSAQYHPIC